jgi:hypothetical protein
MIKTPVLFLIFNRPDTTARVFAAIRAARPKHLFIAADGPRHSHATDADLCSQTRAIIEKIDWPCELKTKLNDSNLGCKTAVSSAITWFFDNVEEGIILEDDCLPDPSFFDYCEQLLHRYRDEPRIMHISGDNFQKPSREYSADIYFSIYNHIWGWATWKRAWALYDVNMSDFTLHETSEILQSMTDNIAFRDYWLQIFQNTHEGKINTWDYQWTYAMWRKNALAILPRVNLISNIGFGSEGTHTTTINWMANLPTSELRLQSFPTEIATDVRADLYTSAKVFEIPASHWIRYLRKARAKLRLRTQLRNFLRIRNQH